VKIKAARTHVNTRNVVTRDLFFSLVLLRRRSRETQSREAGTWSRWAGVDDVDHWAAVTSGPQVLRAAGSRCADAQRKLAAVHRACASADRFRCVTCATYTVSLALGLSSWAWL